MTGINDAPKIESVRKDDSVSPTLPHTRACKGPPARLVEATHWVGWTSLDHQRRRACSCDVVWLNWSWTQGWKDVMVGRPKEEIGCMDGYMDSLGRRPVDTASRDRQHVCRYRFVRLTTCMHPLTQSPTTASCRYCIVRPIACGRYPFARPTT